MAGHQHSHHGSETRLAIAAALTGLFMIAEVAGGIISGSLALIADAGHMLTDFAALSMAWLAFRLSRRPADWKRTYGFDRFQVIVAFANGLTLFFIAGWIVFEAVQRLMTPTEVLGPVMAIVAAAGLVVNIGAFAVLHGAGADNRNLNMRAAMLHVMGDLVGSVAALIAAAIIILTGWMPADPILSIVVALIIVRGAWRVVSDAGHILLEGAPTGFEPETVIADLIEHIDGVDHVHHLHAWSISEDRRMVTLHARIADNIATTSAIAAIKQRLRDIHGIDHATVEIERNQKANA